MKGRLPAFDLVSISHHFLDKLSMAELHILRKIANGLNGQTIKVATTCSGLETGVMATQALFRAIGQRFGCDISVSGEFCAEVDEKKQQFILNAHGDSIKHCFGDVAGLTEETAYCVKTRQHVPIPDVFLLIAGVSCVNLSGERQDRHDYAACYADASGESGKTYQFGYKQAVLRTKASVSIYENVGDACHFLKDGEGNPQPPATATIVEDFAEFGHTFEASKVCNSMFLLPHRRMRAWGSSSFEEPDPSEYMLRMRLTIQRMQSTLRFPLRDILDPDLPETPVTADVFKQQVKIVKKLCEAKGFDFNNVCMDTASSGLRGPEWAHGMTTCCRPTHQIYHCGLRRTLVGKEMLAVQGVCPDSFFACQKNVFVSFLLCCVLSELFLIFVILLLSVASSLFGLAFRAVEASLIQKQWFP